MIKKILGLSLKWKIVGGVVILIVIWGIYHFGFAGNGNTYQFVDVKSGTISEVVNVTGNTIPVQSLTLAFQNSGVITAVYYPVGSRVNAGDVIAKLDTQDLAAQLAQAQASVNAQKATLADRSNASKHSRFPNRTECGATKYPKYLFRHSKHARKRLRGIE